MADVGEFIGGLIGGVIGQGNPAAVTAGSAIGGAVGDLISGAQPSVGVTAAQAGLLSGGFAGPTTSTGTSVGPAVGVPSGFGGVAQAGFVGPAARAGAAVLPTILPRIVDQFIERPGPVPAATAQLPFMTGTRKTMTRKQFILATARANNPGATAKKIIRSARECGIELAAATFGLDVMSVCFLIAQPPTRRARGISAADLRRTRSTLRKVGNIQRDLSKLRSPIRRK